MSLPYLPHELLLLISNLLERLCYTSALAQTNKQLYWHLNNHLYSLDVRGTGGSALIWAAQRGLRRTAWLSLIEGADIEALYVVHIPRPLRNLGFHHTSTRMTPLQIALCYGSDSVARLLINHGATSSLPYPLELCSCTNLHMAAAMGLAPALKILISQGMSVEARDTQLRTPLHYAAIMRHRSSLEQAQVVMLLLLNSADPWTEDSQGNCPVSLGKKRSNPVAKMLSEKGWVVEAYEISLQDRELFEMWCISKEKHEEAVWAEKKKEKQFAIEPEKRDGDRDMMNKKQVVAKPKESKIRSQEQEEMARKTEVQTVVKKHAKDRANELPADHEAVGEASIENPRVERHHGLTEVWSRMRKEADQRILMATKLDVLTNTNCNHLSGLWKCRVQKTCQSCKILAKGLSFCTDCGFVICMRCKLGKGRT